jgi:8-hydroxy-5-deazaflavin:NADPH oxidoreductase
MKLGIIGTGSVAKALTTAFTHHSYRVMIGSRTLDKAQALAGQMERFAEGGTIANTIHYGEIIVLAIPYKGVETALRNIDNYRGKILVDCTNPLTWTDGMADLALGHTTSAAEQIARMAPEARVVKAFNTTFAEMMEQGPYFGPVDGSMFYCGDDTEAKEAVASLIKTTNHEPIDCGPLHSARLLEPLAALIIRLGSTQGLGREIAYKLLQRS